MSSLFIFGNGFDMAHGLPTRYSDFKRFLRNHYPAAEKDSENQFDIYDYLDMPDDEFSVQLLFYAMNNASGLEWNDFENALGYFNFYNKFPRRSDEAKKTDNKQDIIDYLLAVDRISNVMIQSTKHWQEFFRRWIKSVEEGLKKERYLPKKMLVSIFKEPDNLYLTFNYTKTLQKIYGIKKVIHIHNRVGQKLIFGHGDDKSTYNEPVGDGAISSSFLDDLMMAFRKDTISPMKKYNDFFRSLNKDVDKVYSYGFSYSKVDSVYIKSIIERISADSIWHFTARENSNIGAARIKKIKLRRYGFKGNFGVFEG